MIIFGLVIQAATNTAGELRVRPEVEEWWTRKVTAEFFICSMSSDTKNWAGATSKTGPVTTW
ncbi:hypothetical protein [Cupriavidus sp. UYPR2.512]|uniref:hypothetical protein n=1 Tax=Cupriavidus sp. UYPR2.512 TaxID=1080187 RepID=UPI00039AC4DC|nr:hypothetical protein [Cupriavidus sp. UYPR2.512]UIF88532.1 hypothetical protein KAF44_24620 [Cupriavidus necator]